MKRLQDKFEIILKRFERLKVIVEIWRRTGKILKQFKKDTKKVSRKVNNKRVLEKLKSIAFTLFQKIGGLFCRNLEKIPETF